MLLKELHFVIAIFLFLLKSRSSLFLSQMRCVSARSNRIGEAVGWAVCTKPHGMWSLWSQGQSWFGQITDQKLSIDHYTTSVSPVATRFHLIKKNIICLSHLLPRMLPIHPDGGFHQGEDQFHVDLFRKVHSKSQSQKEKAKCWVWLVTKRCSYEHSRTTKGDFNWDSQAAVYSHNLLQRSYEQFWFLWSLGEMNLQLFSFRKHHLTC